MEPEAPAAPVDPHLRSQRRTRRLASAAVAASGFVTLVSSLSAPLRSRLHALQQIVPIGTPRTAAALAAIAGVALLVVASGVRRGQRRA